MPRTASVTSAYRDERPDDRKEMLAVTTDYAETHPSTGWPVESGIYLPVDAPVPDVGCEITWTQRVFGNKATYLSKGVSVTVKHLGTFDPLGPFD